MKKVLGVIILLAGIAVGGTYFFNTNKRLIEDKTTEITAALQAVDMISDIKSNPRRYEGMEVTVEGKVTSSTNLFGFCFYTVSDATGSILVRSKGAAPLENETVQVNGCFRQYLKVKDQELNVICEKTSNSSCNVVR